MKNTEKLQMNNKAEKEEKAHRLFCIAVGRLANAATRSRVVDLLKYLYNKGYGTKEEVDRVYKMFQSCVTLAYDEAQKEKEQQQQNENDKR